MTAQALTEPATNSELADICQRYQKLYSGVIFDYLDHHGLPNQLLASELRPLTLEMKIAGPAFTVKGGVSTVKDETVRYKRLQMITQMTYPCVEVRDRGTPFSVALYGELSATSAKAHGAVGALIDNATRDSGFLIEMGFPVFCRGRNPIEAFGRWAMVDYQVPIRIAGELTNEVLIRPGDFLFGDLDGVLVIPQERTLEVLEECERIVGIEDIAREEFRRGDNPVEVFERHKRL
jgi:regulator of RNase E activity RraA